MDSLVLTSFSKFFSEDPEARNARYAVQTAFEMQPKTVGYGEIDLYCCHYWNKDLHFAMLIDNPIDGNHTWYSCRVVINPSAPNSDMVKNQQFLPRVAMLKALALKFNVSGFDSVSFGERDHDHECDQKEGRSH